MNFYLTFSEALEIESLKDRSDLFVVNLYRAYDSDLSRATPSVNSPHLDVNALVKAFRHAGLCGWSIRDLEMPECRSKELDVSFCNFAPRGYSTPNRLHMSLDVSNSTRKRCKQSCRC